MTPTRNDHAPHRPRIALTAWTRVLETGVIGPSEMATVSTDYVGCVQRAGGVAVVLPVDHADSAATAMAGMDGLVLIGGNDVDPASYGRVGDGRSSDVSAEADAFEVAVTRAAVAAGLPVLAVCRGMQVLNVALGGSLHEDVEDIEDVVTAVHRAPTSAADAVLGLRHEVHAAPGSRLHGLYGPSFEVNSIHHQAVERVADGLLVTGRSSDGVIEAVEGDTGLPSVTGVQWHPEKIATGQPLFDWLLDAAAGRRRSGRDVAAPRP